MKLRNMTTIYIKLNDKILLLYRIGSKVGEDSWRGYGGHFEEELNDPKKALLRELEEESGLIKDDLYNLKLRYITIRLKNNEIRQNYYYFAELKNNNIKLKNNVEGFAKFFDFKDIFSLKMPFTAKYVLEHYYNIGKYNGYTYSGIASQDRIDFIKMDEF